MSLTRRGPLASRSVSHLLLSGYNPLSPPASAQPPSSSGRQSRSNPSLSPVPLSTWLSQLGREVDTYSGPNLVTSVSSATGHALASYRNYAGVDRVIALGRNESGQLGIGFASQEGTRGLVEGFDGDQVLKVETAVQASYLLVREDESRNRLYSIGNLSRGRLGHSHLYSRSTDHSHDEEQDDGSDPVAKILPRATLVDQGAIPEQFGKIVDIRTGYEHLLVLTESGEIFGTGCNTDGQLGLGTASDVYSLERIPVPASIRDREGGVDKIVAGADTSGFITKSGKLFTWGNSEYAQAFHGKKIDQIVSPLAIAQETFLEHGAKRIIDYQCGGSFGVVLDDRHNVYTTGYGALGHSLPPPSSSSSTNGTQPLFNPTPTLVQSLTPSALSSSSSSSSSVITRIRAAYGYAVAISDRAPPSPPSPPSPPFSTDSKLDGDTGTKRTSATTSVPRMWSWGVNNEFGRLGLGTTSSSRGGPGGGGGKGKGIIDEDDRAGRSRVENAVYEPREVKLPTRELGLDHDHDHDQGDEYETASEWGIGLVELGDEGMWVELRERVKVRDGERGGEGISRRE